jgi:uncharacterized protein (DUF1810 family)
MPTSQSRDPFDLERFVQAQKASFDQALLELRQGSKRSHWMWYVFPQLRGLGQSRTSRRFGISCLDEARAYLAHPILGPRLLECTRLVLQSGKNAPDEIFPAPDDMKFCSCMTLFARAAPEEAIFSEALRKFCGRPDALTLRLLGISA